ncbi:MAG: hypothetical protein ACRD29_10770 [Acidimicrobiales bacterium]
MLICCWSAKGGVGTTVVATGLALLLSRQHATGAVLVDLGGDAPTVLGIPEPPGPALVDWLAAGDDVPADALAHLEHPATAGVGLVPRGVGPLEPARADVLAGVLAAEPRPVVVDCGWLGDDRQRSVGAPLAARADTSLLVLRPCFLGLRRVMRLGLRPTGVVLLAEDGRVISATDIEGVLGVPVVASIRVTPTVARAVDAGLLASALPRSLERELRRAA